MMRAEYFMEKTIRERMEELRRLRLEEEDRRAWQEALRLARIKYSAQYAQEMWDYLHEWSLTEGVERVIAHRAYLEYLKSREGRVVTAFTRFARRLETRRRGAVLSRVALFRITLGRVFQSHDRRQDAARDIQCAFRILMARRTFLMAYIEREARMLDQEKADVWRKWAARLARAIQSIAHVETEAHRQARRRVWARTEFSRALAKAHFFTYGHPPSRDPPAVTSFQKPCDGRVALRLPDTKASKIVAPIGDDSPEARRLNWIGVPVGVALAKNEKGIGYRPRKGISTPDHFSLIYMPMPTHLLSVSFADARSRQKAQDDLENLKASALRPNQHIEEAPESATDWYEREQALLWGNTSALVDEV
ncbi:Hypothetical Protein FCC1311_026592 [Hondaea fermentalgiana]|uniref:Uncharacterized protein n=1 Tax=Hondaea fermentalgiana TaxID=2315210 RepID=A0A2R5G9M0_9STRA|nr:Hypothetical Protein FCC1311_026592 [Hondaea fermentalgiana]|eukprot:GBG26438.1 Hypothetical Protein FCC1311_026592 [Hondaea fermentalgiana]